MAKTNMIDRMRGCLIGGAVGDALGYPIEFLKWDEIKKQYGDQGVKEYPNGVGIVSDDTQMTLFTADGLLRDSEPLDRRFGVKNAYRDWYYTQITPPGVFVPTHGCCQLLCEPDLYVQRAPGITCMSAIRGGGDGSLANPINDSKGCGGVMRVAPVGMLIAEPHDAAREGARCAALTHGHELGYMTAGMLAALISIIVGHPNWHMEKCIRVTLAACEHEFINFDYMLDLADIVEAAIEYAIFDKEHGGDSQVSIEMLGEGWVAEEALAIALYCALRYENDFEGGIIAAVNHDGDSDSTGAITGNILGAYLGEEAIPKRFKEKLQFKDLLRSYAGRLFDERK